MKTICLLFALLYIQVGLLTAGLVDKFEQRRDEVEAATGPYGMPDQDLNEQLTLTENEFDDKKYQDCDDVRQRGGYEQSGDYNVYLNTTVPHKVNCRFGLGYTRTAIMQQKYGRYSFAQPWHIYKTGFGSVSGGDFWLGLDAILTLTRQGTNVLTITMQDWLHRIKVIQYSHFSIGPDYDGYRLSIGGYMSSHVLPDDLSHNNGMIFATYDRPDANKCAANQHGGWWYNHCTLALPTGKYYSGGHYVPAPGQYFDGIYYKDWLGFDYSLKYIRMELSHV